MEKYINQLIEDLEEAAKHPPAPDYIESPSHLKETPDISELALVPFKPISELVGINSEFFPEMFDLNINQCKRVTNAIFKVFESLHLELVDAPLGLPPEILYEVITTNWQHPVQYLPSSGMDLELCTGDPLTCPYGEYCDCNEEWDEEEEIPEHFDKIIHKIAETINAGFRCYLNPETLEMEEIPKPIMNDLDENLLTSEYGLDNEELKHKTWDQYYVFEPLESHESFKVMELFAEIIEDKKFNEQLFYALNHKQPFAKFKWKIDNSPYRQNWFDFKQNWLEKHIKKIIWSKINEIQGEYHEEINGFYNDDGTKIDTDSVPVPNLCVICKSHLADDWEENLLCLMNRNDQRNDDDFKCGMFEKI